MLRVDSALDVLLDPELVHKKERMVKFRGPNARLPIVVTIVREESKKRISCAGSPSLLLILVIPIALQQYIPRKTG